jgi:protein-S-isoprenylcysteine O-methyltransferase Ste14
MPTQKEPTSGAPTSAAPTSAAPASQTRAESKNMLPPRERRRSRFERLVMRLIATCGIVAIGVAIGAIMTSSRSQGWIIGLVVSIVSVVLAAVLWSSRQL